MAKQTKVNVTAPAQTAPAPAQTAPAPSGPVLFTAAQANTIAAAAALAIAQGAHMPSSKYTFTAIAQGTAVTALPNLPAFFTAGNSKGPFFTARTGKFTGRMPNHKATSYNGALAAAMHGKQYGPGIVAGLVACACTPGAVPNYWLNKQTGVNQYIGYQHSYALVAHWLVNNGPNPGATHIQNCAKHLAGYVNGTALNARHWGWAVK